jgi:hypothetical protein
MAFINGDFNKTVSPIIPLFSYKTLVDLHLLDNKKLERYLHGWLKLVIVFESLAKKELLNLINLEASS